MKINMLIVDDEPIICQGLRETVPWEQAGVEVVAEAYDGEEALGLIAELGVDLVLTDINMPEMDGLQLAEAIKASMPHVRIVILTGYGEFEYARQAVRLGVEDFLLKPADVSEMVGMVARIAGEIRESRARDMRSDRERRLQSIRELMLEGKKPQTLDLFGLRCDGASGDAAGDGCCRFVASQTLHGADWLGRAEDSFSSEGMERWKSRIELALEPLGLQPLSFVYRENVMLTLCRETGPDRLPDDEWAAALKRAANGEEGGERLVFVVSERFRCASDARRCGLEAVEALHAGSADPSRSVWFAEQLAASGLGEERIEWSPDTEKAILQAFARHDKEEVAARVREWIAELRGRRCNVKELFRLYAELRVLVMRRLRAGGPKAAERASVPHVKEFDLHQINTFEAAEAVIVEELMTLLSAAQPGTAGKNRWIVERAKDYIDRNAHQDLKASEVAAWLKITPSYFSLLFKQHEGRSFTEYVNELRIERAKSYLSETHDRVFEIADKVGYKDYKYFVSVFKALTGVTPTDYRNRERSGRAG